MHAEAPETDRIAEDIRARTQTPREAYVDEEAVFAGALVSTLYAEAYERFGHSYLWSKQPCRNPTAEHARRAGSGILNRGVEWIIRATSA